MLEVIFQDGFNKMESIGYFFLCKNHRNEYPVHNNWLFWVYLIYLYYIECFCLTLYRAASDPTYLERGGRNQPAPQFSARGAPIGQIMIPPQTFSVNVVYKKRIGSIGQKLGPWPQFENFRNWPIWPKDRFSRISFRPYKNWHSSVIFGPIDPIFFANAS